MKVIFYINNCNFSGISRNPTLRKIQSQPVKEIRGFLQTKKKANTIDIPSGYVS